MKYAVQQYYYDTGQTRIIPPVKTTDDCQDVVEEDCNLYRNCDYYRDVFNTLEKAEEFYQECLEA